MNRFLGLFNNIFLLVPMKDVPKENKFFMDDFKNLQNKILFLFVPASRMMLGYCELGTLHYQSEPS